MTNYSENLKMAIDALKTYLNEGSYGAGYFAAILYDNYLTTEERKEYKRVEGEIIANWNLPF